MNDPDDDSRLLGELLAVIHGDGGHYQALQGSENATRDAIKKVNDVRIALDAAEYKIGTLQAELDERVTRRET